jgi:hypothetical protein
VSEIVDTPNFVVTAVLPLAIFDEGGPVGTRGRT